MNQAPLAAMGRPFFTYFTCACIDVPPPENQFVVPPLGGSLWRHGMDLHPTLPPKGGTTNCAFHCFGASQRDMNDSLKMSIAIVIPTENLAQGVGAALSNAI